MSLRRAVLVKLPELKNYTTIKIGGRAAFFCLVDNLDQLGKVLDKAGSSWYLLGNGSNLLVSDSLIEKPIIKLGREFNYIKKRTDSLEAGAATSLAFLMNYCLKGSLAGLENLAGIPATVGGLVAMNASAYGGDILSRVLEVCLIGPQGNIYKVKGQDLAFGYRSCSLGNSIVVWVRFNLSKSEGLKQRLGSFVQKRLSSQDFSLPSCGCIFKNPEGKKAGSLIDDCGLKGIQKGGAQVSLIHANFIVNKGGASYADADYLIQRIKSEVYKKYSIILDEEIKRWS